MVFMGTTNFCGSPILDDEIELIMVPQNKPDESKLGYWFFPPESKQAPGGSRLDVVIEETPTLMHFDPQKITFNVKSKDGFLEKINIFHPWHFDPSYQALTGLVEIVDRKGKKEEAFIFGGNLTIEARETSTTCSLTSPVPILQMSRVGSQHMMFIEEVEILFAERSASLLSEHSIYEAHLANADPLQLYMACLQTLIEKFDSLKRVPEPRIQDFIAFLHGERKRLKEDGSLSGQSPTLEDIL
jgi:hypothetical protein